MFFRVGVPLEASYNQKRVPGFIPRLLPGLAKVKGQG